MTKSYRVVVRPDIRYALSTGGPSEPELTKEMLVGAIADVVVRDVTRTLQGQRVVDVELERPSHEAALDELVRVLQQLGFSYIEATVTEWLSKTADGFVLGAGGGGLLGTTSKNPIATLIGAVVGAVIGGLVGAAARELADEYRVRWHPRTGWVLTKVPNQRPAPSLHPAFA